MKDNSLPKLNHMGCTQVIESIASQIQIVCIKTYISLQRDITTISQNSPRRKNIPNGNTHSEKRYMLKIKFGGIQTAFYLLNDIAPVKCF